MHSVWVGSHCHEYNYLTVKQHAMKTMTEKETVDNTVKPPILDSLR